MYIPALETAVQGSRLERMPGDGGQGGEVDESRQRSPSCGRIDNECAIFAPGGEIPPIGGKRQSYD